MEEWNLGVVEWFNDECVCVCVTQLYLFVSIFLFFFNYSDKYAVGKPELLIFLSYY